MTRLPTSPHQDTVHHGSFPSRVNPYQTILPLVAAWNLHFPPGRTFGIFWLHWHEFRPCFNQFEPHLRINNINMELHQNRWYHTSYESYQSYIYTCYKLQFLHHIFFWGKYTTPSVGARLKGPRNLRSKWGPEIWSRAGLESDSRRFHWYSSHIDIFPVIDIR